MNRGKPKRTACDRCGKTLKYRVDYKPEYCEDCCEHIRRQSAF